MMPGCQTVPKSSVLDHALAYVEEHGLVLCLLRPQSKLPVIAAWNDPRRGIRTQEATRQALSTPIPYGIGVVHQGSRTAAFDVDHLDSTRALFAEFGWDYEELMGQFPRIKTRAGKDKILVRLPEGFEPGEGGIGSKIKLNWPDPTGECDASGKVKQITVLELRGGANQDVLPPSIHPDTMAPYAWERAPWDFDGGIPVMPADHPLLLVWREWEKFRPQFEAACPWLPSAEAPQHAQPARQTDTGGQNIIGRYNAAHSCADLLAANGYRQKGRRWLAPHSSTKIPGVVELSGGKVYSHHASDILNTGHAHDAFSLLTVLEYGGSLDKALQAAAHELGLSLSEPVPSVDFSAFLRGALGGKQAPPQDPPQQPEPEQPAPAPADSGAVSGAFPAHLLDVPGMVGDVARYLESSAMYPQPVLSLAASLAFCGALLGRKVQGHTGIRSNIYTMGVAPSGSGKEHARKGLKRLALAADATQWIGAEKIASDQGLFVLLESQPSCVVLMDEFGRTLRQMTNDKAPPHVQALMTYLMELTGSADSFIMEKRRAEHTNGVQPKVVHYPNLCIYATTVPGRLYQGLTPDEITDGFLPRWLVFESDTPDPEPAKPATTEPAEWLCKAVKTWAEQGTNHDPHGNLDYLNHNPLTIAPDQAALSVFSGWDVVWRARKKESRKQGTDALWARAMEHALRLALVRGAGHLRRVAEDDAVWACELADYLVSNVARQALANVATNEYEGQVQKVEAFIRRAGSCSFSDLTIAFRWLKQKERDAILGSMMDAHLIRIEQLPASDKAGRRKTLITWDAD